MSCKRDQLIQTGEALFTRHGLRRVTVEEICRRAGVSKPTFYKHFQNKAALARCIAEGWIAQAVQRVDEIERSPAPFPAKLERILALKQEIAARPGPEFLEDLIALDVDLGPALQRVLRFFVEGQGRGDIRADVRPEFLLAAFDLLNRLHHDPAVRGLYPDIAALAADVLKLFCCGALSPAHREAGLPGGAINPDMEELC